MKTVEILTRRNIKLYFKDKGIFENRVYDGAEKLLSDIKNSGRKIVLATSKPEVFARRILEHFGLTIADIGSEKLKHLPTLIEKEGCEKVAKELNIGEPTLIDIAGELAKPGRDIRDDLPKPMLKSELLGIENLKEGMVMMGVVRNVIDFGAFVDISVHQDGLVHISEISKDYIKHPSEVLKVGDVVKVKIMSVDLVKKRIALTIKGAEGLETTV